MGITLGSVGNIIKNEPDGKKQATIKGAEIAKLGPLPRRTIGQYDIEVIGLQAIEGGVAAFVRAWDQNGQIGFGPDGSVDIERFRIFNPVIMVPDGTKFEAVDSEGRTYHDDNLVEDLEAALFAEITHALKVKKQKFGPDKIFFGKVGNTTSTFNPVAGANSPVDGGVVRSGVNEVFGTIRGGAGTASPVSDTYLVIGMLEASGTTDQFQGLYRSIICFDTSAIGDTDTISSAVLSFQGFNEFALSTGLGAFSLDVVAATPAATNDLADSDYAQLGSTSFATKASGAITEEGAYNDWSLDANGIANISKTGVSKFGTRTLWDLNNSFTGTWASGASSYWNARSADQGSTPPKLVVEHVSGDLDISVFDAITVTEAVTMMVDENINVFDGVTVSEAVTMMMDLNINVFDDVTITESFSGEVVTPTDPPLIIENITVGESVTVHILELVPSVFDTVTITESVDLDVPAAKDGLVRLRSSEQSYPLMMDDDENR